MKDFFDRYGDLMIPEPNSGCLIWLGSTTSAGYGNLTRDGRSFYAHRCAFEAENGEGSADGKVVRHQCDTPACVNPGHLLSGTAKDNVEDAVRRGRLRPVRGESHPRAILSDEIVLEIRRSAATGEHIAAIARRFGISHRQASDVLSGATWSHVGEIPAAVGKWTPPAPPFGDDAPRAILTTEKVLEIRRRLASGASGRALAREFGVSAPTISAIKTRRIWPHV